MSIRLKSTSYRVATTFEPASPAKKVGSYRDFIARANAVLESHGNKVFGCYKRKLEKARANNNNT